MTPSADLCRSRGWVVGDVIVGTSCTGRTVAWVITAIGEELVAKRTVATLIDGEWILQDADECLGDLGFRGWTKATPEQLAAIRPTSSPRAPIVLAEELNDVRETCVRLLGCKTRREAAALLAEGEAFSVVEHEEPKKLACLSPSGNPLVSVREGWAMMPEEYTDAQWEAAESMARQLVALLAQRDREQAPAEDRTEPAPGYVVGLPGSRPWTLSDAQGTLRSTCATRAEAVARSWELHAEEVGRC